MSSSPETQLFMSAPVAYVDVGTAKIAYRKFGEGPPILMVHGWPLHGFTWRKLIPDLSKKYTCIAIDLAGAGLTEWDDTNDFSFHGHADNLLKFVRAIGLERYRMIAHDTGATVARRLASLEGDRVTHGAYIDTEIPFDRPPLVPFMQKLMKLPGARATFQALLRSRRFLRSSSGFGGCFVDLNLIEGDFHEHFVKPMIESKRRMQGQLEYAKGIDWPQLDLLAEDHKRISARTLLIWGDRDPFFPLAKAREMVPQMPNCKGLVVIENAKIFPHEEYPDQVNKHVFELFAE